MMSVRKALLPVAILFCVLGAKPAVKFEVRRAETKPAAGLTEVTIEGDQTKLYLHDEPVLTNKDIAEVRLADNAVDVTFSADGKKKMTKVCADHQGKPLAILVDGKVIAAPILKGQIVDKARITVATKAEAERIAKGIRTTK